MFPSTARTRGHALDQAQPFQSHIITVLTVATLMDAIAALRWRRPRPRSSSRPARRRGVDEAAIGGEHQRSVQRRPGPAFRNRRDSREIQTPVTVFVTKTPPSTSGRRRYGPAHPSGFVLIVVEDDRRAGLGGEERKDRRSSRCGESGGACSSRRLSSMERGRVVSPQATRGEKAGVPRSGTPRGNQGCRSRLSRGIQRHRHGHEDGAHPSRDAKAGFARHD